MENGMLNKRAQRKSQRLTSYYKSLGAVAAITLLLLSTGCSSTSYATTDAADYGTIKGNGNNAKASEFIFAFFPEQIEPYFSDVTYSYSAEKDGRFEYECYLEFTIADKKRFESFLTSHVSENEATVFSFDSSFMEYSLSNYLYIDELFSSDEKGYPITYASIEKILYSREEQRFIFVAIGVSELAYTKDIHVFFDRFDIDPMEYQMTAYTGDAYPGGPPVPYTP